MICVNSGYLGTPQHLVMDDDDMLAWVETRPIDAWTWGFPQSSRQIEDVVNIFGVNIGEFIPAPQRKAMVTVLSGPSKPIPWRWVLSAKEFNDRLKQLLEELKGLLSAFDDSGYANTYAHSCQFLESFSRESGILSPLFWVFLDTFQVRKQGHPVLAISVP